MKEFLNKSACLILLSTMANADPRCEWTDCSANSSSSGSSISESWTVGNSSTGSCVEAQSSECAGQCKKHYGSFATRCRLDCLMKACPNSSKYDASLEAANPGASKCEKCRASLGDQCATLCAIGGMIGYTHPTTGLASFACQRACYAARCGTDCVFNPTISDKR